MGGWRRTRCWRRRAGRRGEKCWAEEQRHCFHSRGLPQRQPQQPGHHQQAPQPRGGDHTGGAAPDSSWLCAGLGTAAQQEPRPVRETGVSAAPAAVPGPRAPEALPHHTLWPALGEPAAGSLQTGRRPPEPRGYGTQSQHCLPGQINCEQLLPGQAEESYGGSWGPTGSVPPGSRNHHCNTVQEVWWVPDWHPHLWNAALTQSLWWESRAEREGVHLCWSPQDSLPFPLLSRASTACQLPAESQPFREDLDIRSQRNPSVFALGSTWGFVPCSQYIFQPLTERRYTSELARYKKDAADDQVCREVLGEGLWNYSGRLALLSISGFCHYRLTSAHCETHEAALVVEPVAFHESIPTSVPALTPACTRAHTLYNCYKTA